jgi:hypothetical protein
MRGNELFSLGAILFYFLVGLVLLSSAIVAERYRVSRKLRLVEEPMAATPATAVKPGSKPDAVAESTMRFAEERARRVEEAFSRGHFS